MEMADYKICIVHVDVEWNLGQCNASDAAEYEI